MPQNPYQSPAAASDAKPTSLLNAVGAFFAQILAVLGSIIISTLVMIGIALLILTIFVAFLYFTMGSTPSPTEGVPDPSPTSVPTSSPPI